MEERDGRRERTPFGAADRRAPIEDEDHTAGSKVSLSVQVLRIDRLPYSRCMLNDNSTYTGGSS